MKHLNKVMCSNVVVLCDSPMYRRYTTVKEKRVLKAARHDWIMGGGTGVSDTTIAQALRILARVNKEVERSAGHAQ